MKFDVFGGIFWDSYLDSEEKIISEGPGGSALNVARGIRKLGGEVRLFGNLGNDEYSEAISNLIEEEEIDDNLVKREMSTGFFEAKEDETFKISRGANDAELSLEQAFASPTEDRIMFLTTELDGKDIERLLKIKYKRVYIDIGPRPQILKDIEIPEACVLIGNEEEAKNFENCDIIKRGEKGASVNGKFIKGNQKVNRYQTGSGDVFDSVYIFLKEKGIAQADDIAVKLAEINSVIPGGFRLESIRGEVK